MEKHQKRSKIILMTIVIILLLVAFVNPLTNYSSVQAIEPEPPYEPIDRFGITVPYNDNVDELIENINVRAVLDWRLENTNMNLAEGGEYIHVIRVSDAAWADGALLTTLSSVVPNHPGDVWIVGNEPDRFYYQDSVTAEVYAQRYYDIAIRIRNVDPTAQIGFGSVVQPTPIRIRYLERALNHLTHLSCGNRQAALDLIDIWSIHSFILNEHPEQWGAAIPVGFENDWSDAIQITDYSDTYSSDIFIQRLKYFRNWMNTIGETDKPLWITEYGSLLPPFDPTGGPNYVNVSDELTAQFMVDTFDFMTTSEDDAIGFISDNNQLVQRWFWYSLNEYRYVYGGSLFDPDKNYERTFVGDAFANYTNQILSNPPSGESPVLYRQTAPIYPVFFDQSLGTYNYPYEICYRTNLPLVTK